MIFSDNGNDFSNVKKIISQVHWQNEAKYLWKNHHKTHKKHVVSIIWCCRGVNERDTIVFKQIQTPFFVKKMLWSASCICCKIWLNPASRF